MMRIYDMSWSIDDVADSITEDQQPIEVITWVDVPHELDLADVYYLLTEAQKPGINIETLTQEDVDNAYFEVHPQSPTPEGIHDEDVWEDLWMPRKAVVLYRGKGSIEEIARDYIKKAMRR